METASARVNSLFLLILVLKIINLIFNPPYACGKPKQDKDIQYRWVSLSHPCPPRKCPQGQISFQPFPKDGGSGGLEA